MGQYVPAPEGDSSPGVAPGGRENEVLRKASDLNYDTEWVSASSLGIGGGGGGTITGVTAGTGLTGGGTTGTVSLAVDSTVVTTAQTGTVTNTMLAGSITNAKLADSTISGVALGGTLSALTLGTGLSGTSYNGSAAVTAAVSYGTAAGTACQGNDARLSDTRNTANLLTFNSGGAGGASGSTFNGSSALTVSYNTLGAAASNQGMFIGTTSVAINRASANLALTGISSVTFPGVTSGSVQLIPAAAAGTGTVLTMPATTGTVVTTGDSGTVTSTMIADGAITNTDINASAAIATSKLASFTAGQVLLGNATGVPTATTVTGDVTITSGGVTALGAGVIVDADVNASAAIAGTKISPNFGSQNIATTGLISGELTPTAGTSTAGTAPLKFTSGTNLATPEAGAVEYDGAVAYFTPDATIGRGFIPATSTFRLTSAGGSIGNTIANFFGTTSNIPLVANAFYEIDIYMLALRGSTGGTATITLTNSAVPTLMFVDYEQSPIAGAPTPPGSVTALTNLYFRGTTTTTTAAYAITTGTLTASVNHYFKFKLLLQNGTGTSLKIQMTAGTGNNSMTPQAGSAWFCRRLPGANTGTFAA